MSVNRTGNLGQFSVAATNCSLRIEAAVALAKCVHLASSDVAIQVVGQRQISESPIVLDAKFVHRGHDSIGLHFDVRPHRVIVEHKESVGLHLCCCGGDITLDVLIGVLGVDVDPIEIGIRKRLQSFRRVGFVNVDPLSAREFQPIHAHVIE